MTWRILQGDCREVLRTVAAGGTPSFISWAAMLTRCMNRKRPVYANYGGRGITVCERWQGEDGFANFLADMGERPQGKTLDRVDNAKGYGPGNCRWATPKEQARNRRQAKRTSEVKP